MISLITEKISLPQNSQKNPSQVRRSAVNMSSGADCFTSSKAVFKGGVPEEAKVGSFTEVLFGGVRKLFDKKSRSSSAELNTRFLAGSPYKY